MRLYTHIQKFSKKIFQSTHPSRGATGPVSAGGDKSTDFNPRTPHGVRRPGDQANGDYRHFNPRTPHGVRPGRAALFLGGNVFQSTHPSRGATTEIGVVRGLTEDFNPRTPHGVRRPEQSEFPDERYFNPRTPHGVRRPGRGIYHSEAKISIHAPLTGCDRLAPTCCSKSS